MLGDFHQHVVGMVPCVPGLVVGRRWKPAVGAALAPVRLTLQLCPVARGTLGRVDPRALLDEKGILRIEGERIRAFAWREEDVPDGRRDG
jgi:hypothetical protein